MPKYKKKDKFILDPCCGPKHMWFNKNHPNVIFGDIRREKKGFNWHRKNAEINPDMIIDFRDLPFPDRSFKLVTFDPPHYVSEKPKPLQMQIGDGTLSEYPRKGGVQITVLKYGLLIEEDWKRYLKAGFDECWRVLEDFGVLIFKWSEVSKSYKEVLKVIGKEPLFHHISGKYKKMGTYWAVFMKLPEKYNQQETLI